MTVLVTGINNLNDEKMKYTISLINCATIRGQCPSKGANLSTAIGSVSGDRVAFG